MLRMDESTYNILRKAQEQVETLVKIARTMRMIDEGLGKEIVEEAIKIARKIREDWDRVETLHYHIARKIPDASQAKKILGEALKIANGVDGEFNRGRLLRNIAHTMAEIGDERAEGVMKEARETFKRSIDKNWVADPSKREKETVSQVSIIELKEDINTLKRISDKYKGAKGDYRLRACVLPRAFRYTYQKLVEHMKKIDKDRAEDLDCELSTRPVLPLDDDWWWYLCILPI